MHCTLLVHYYIHCYAKDLMLSELFLQWASKLPFFSACHQMACWSSTPHSTWICFPRNVSFLTHSAFTGSLFQTFLVTHLIWILLSGMCLRPIKTLNGNAAGYKKQSFPGLFKSSLSGQIRLFPTFEHKAVYSDTDLIEFIIIAYVALQQSVD